MKLDRLNKRGNENASIIMDGQRIYYNFIRPHMALNGKTPAEQAKIDIDLRKNKWLSLVKDAMKNNSIS